MAIPTKITERPIKEGNHTQGEWSLFWQDQEIYVQTENRIDAIASITNENQEDLANALLIVQAPKLLEFAEMFFDKLKSEGDCGLVFNELLLTLHKIKG